MSHPLSVSLQKIKESFNFLLQFVEHFLIHRIVGFFDVVEEHQDFQEGRMTARV